MRARTIMLAVVVMGCRQGARGADTAGATAATMGAPASLPVDTSHHAAAPAAPGAAPADSARITRSGATNVQGPGGAAPLPRHDRATSAPTRSAAGAQAAHEDTLRGTPAVVGTDRFSRVILKPAGGGTSIILAGPQARLVGKASGAEVWVAGTRQQGGQFVVSRFEVRTVDGAPAFDGTLERSGSQYYLVTADGKRHAVNNVPAALQAHVGERVWMTGDLAKGPVTFGVLGKAG